MWPLTGWPFTMGAEKDTVTQLATCHQKSRCALLPTYLPPLHTHTPNIIKSHSKNKTKKRNSTVLEVYW